MKFLKTITLLLFIPLILTGCIRLTNYPVNVHHTGKINATDRKIALLNSSVFTPDLITALASQGFKVVPIAGRYYETDQINRNKRISFNHASARYGLTLYAQSTAMRCVFSDNEMIKATLTVTDLRTGEVVLILNQEGADGSCPPIPPIWDGLAKKLAGNWN